MQKQAVGNLRFVFQPEVFLRDYSRLTSVFSICWFVSICVWRRQCSNGGVTVAPDSEGQTMWKILLTMRNTIVLRTIKRRKMYSTLIEVPPLKGWGCNGNDMQWSQSIRFMWLGDVHCWTSCRHCWLVAGWALKRGGFPIVFKEIRRTKTIQNSITPFGKEHQPYNDQFYVGSRRWFPANVFLSSGSGLPSHFCNVSGAEAATRKVPGAAKMAKSVNLH